MTDYHQNLSVALLRSTVSSLLILICFVPFSVSRGKNRKISRHLPLQNQLMDDHQTLSVAFLGNIHQACSYYFELPLLRAA
jgi:hypothetical protein